MNKDNPDNIITDRALTNRRKPLNVFQMNKDNPDNIITDVDFTEKKTSPRPADPVILGEPEGGDAQDEAHRKLVIEPFPDGHVFKYTPHPKTEGAFVLFNIQNFPVAVVGSQAVADLICQAVQMLFAAAAVARAEGEAQAAALAKLTEQAGSPVMES